MNTHANTICGPPQVDNLQTFLGGCAKKWYDFRLVKHQGALWESWKESFLLSFGEDQVGRWDDTILHHVGGAFVGYYFEKLRLLQLAVPHLPDSSVVALVLHCLPTHIQQMVKIRGPRQPDTLLQCLQDISGNRLEYRKQQLLQTHHHTVGITT